jgi:prepilin-type N-terminal cleavage/methylation domain-containing protein
MIKFKSQNSAFTIVELAIVMVIIGIILSSILYGGQLILNAKISKATSQLKSISASAEFFKNQYKKYPGDYDKFSEKFGNCQYLLYDVSASCNGNGNGDIDTEAEAALVYFQLTFTQLLSGRYNGQWPSTGGPAIGDSFPDIIDGNTVILSTFFNFNSNYDLGRVVIFSFPEQAVSIEVTSALDIKLDDGRPTGGNFLTYSSMGQTTLGGINNNTTCINATDGIYLPQDTVGGACWYAYTLNQSF